MSGEERIDIENRWIQQMHQDDAAAAFEQMYRYYFPKLSQFVFRYIHSEEIAQDIVQNVFFSVWQNRKNIKAQGKLRSYLYTATRNKALTYLRDQKNRNHIELKDLSTFESPVITPEEMLTFNEFEQAVLEAVQCLPERRRQIFLMNREDALTYKEIAEVLGLSIKTVETQISRSLKSLRKALSHFLAVLIF